MVADGFDVVDLMGLMVGLDAVGHVVGLDVVGQVVARLVAWLRSAWWLEVSTVEIGVEIGIWWVWWCWHGGRFLDLVADV